VDQKGVKELFTLLSRPLQRPRAELLLVDDETTRGIRSARAAKRLEGLMLHRIMVPLDGSPFAERALQTAALLARRHGSQLYLVRVHQPQVPVTPEGVAAYDPVFEQELEEQGRRYLDRVLSGFEPGEQARAFTAYLRGAVTETLSEYAREQGIDLIVMTTHARGPIGRVWLGSVADGLVRHSVTPVLLVPPGRETAADTTGGPLFPRVLLPVDGGTAEDRMIEHAIAVGGTTGVEYTLLRVITDGALSALPPRPRRGENPGSRVQRTTVKTALGVKADELRARGLQVRPEVVVDNGAAEGIVGFAAANEIDLIAMATRSRGGLERLLLGSVADRVLRKAETALLLWNPGPVQASQPAEAPAWALATPAPTSAS
jgi:nucleotide-binding universal stress UspA family protein